MELGLKGKSAIITGGSRGIGRAIAERLAEQGCHLHLAARSAEDLQIAQDELTSKYGISVQTYAVDLSDSDNVRALAGVCSKADILVNNAGAIPAGSLTTIDEATWRFFSLRIEQLISAVQSCTVDGGLSSRGNLF